MNNSKLLIAAIVFPILILIGMAVQHAYGVKNGGLVTLKITGYDPRHLLSGHYLTYRVDFEVDKPETLCPSYGSHQKAYICFSDKREFVSERSALKNCPLYIKGTCNYSVFSAGIERFYIPQEFAKELDTVVQDGKGQIIVSIQKDGKGIVKDLLIDNLHYKDWVKAKRSESK